MPYGDTPYLQRGGQEDPRRIFQSDYDIAAKLDVSIPPGMGIIPAGAIMAKISESSGRLGMYVPYTPEQPEVGLTTVPGGAYLTQDGAADKLVYVTMSDSYKFAVGDHLAVGDNNSYDGTAVDLGAITAIDRTTYSHIAMITVTNNVTTAVTVAEGAFVWIQSTTAAPFVLAKGVLVGTVDTGTGENAKGGAGVVCVGRAELYVGSLYNYNSDVATDLSATVLNNQIISI